MTNKELTEIAIRKVIETGMEQDIPNQPMFDIQDIFMGVFGFEEYESDGDQEYNGWAGDFWFTFHHPELGEYTVSGSVWERIPWNVYKKED